MTILKALITGGNGSVGEGICEKLIETFGSERIELNLICRSQTKGMEIIKKIMKKLKIEKNEMSLDESGMNYRKKSKSHAGILAPNP